MSMNCPAGKNWVSVDGEYKAITVSGKVIVLILCKAWMKIKILDMTDPVIICIITIEQNQGHVWAVDMTDRIWWRKGAKADSPTGSSWKVRI